MMMDGDIHICDNDDDYYNVGDNYCCEMVMVISFLRWWIVMIIIAMIKMTMNKIYFKHCLESLKLNSFKN